MTTDGNTVTIVATDLVLDAIVRADAAYIADLVIDGRTTEADEFAQRPDVQARIQRWKQTKQ